MGRKRHVKEEKPPRYIKPIPKYIKPAGIGKRAGAFFLDVILAAVLWFASYYTLGVCLMAPNMGYYEIAEQFNDVLQDTALVYYNATNEEDSNNYTQLDLESQNNDVYITVDGINVHFSDETEYEEGEDYTYGFQIYERVVWSYYTHFLLREDTGFNLDENVTTYEEAARYVLENIYGLTEENNYQCIVLTIDEVDYGYTLVLDENGNFDYTAMPILMDSWDELDSYTQQEYAVSFLRFYYYQADDTELFQGCINNVNTEVEIYIDLSSHLDSIAYLIRMPGVFIGAILVFFLIPVCTPNGRSFGKLVTGLAIINTDGFTVPRWKIAIRYGILTLFWGVLLVPTLLLGLVLLLLLYVADALVLMRVDRPQAIHDLPTGTIVVDIKESIWFKNEEDKQEYIRNNPDSSIALDEAEANKEPEPTGPDYSADIFDYTAILKEREYLNAKDKNEAFDDSTWEGYARKSKKDNSSSKPENLSGEVKVEEKVEEPPKLQPRVGYKNEEEENEVGPVDDFADSD